MSTESLKRVLMGIKDEARSMRLGKLKSRLEPKAEVTPENIHSMTEGSPEEEKAESPEEAAAENDVALGVAGDGDAPDKEDALIAEIKKLLARV